MGLRSFQGAIVAQLSIHGHITRRVPAHATFVIDTASLRFQRKGFGRLPVVDVALPIDSINLLLFFTAVVVEVAAVVVEREIARFLTLAKGALLLLWVVWGVLYLNRWLEL